MSRPLTGRLVARGDFDADNIIVNGDDVSWKLANPPDTADSVQVKILEDVRDLDGKRLRTGLTGGFLGEIRDKRFKTKRVFGGPPALVPDPALFHITHPEGREEGHILGFTPAPERVSEHLLTLVTEHRVDGKRVGFIGQHQIEVRQSLAMVVPGGTAHLDTALNQLSVYADKWKQYQPGFRHVRHAKIFVTKNIPKPLPEHFDDVIERITEAATLAKSGVVALALGHGVVGDSNESVTFFNFVPEDNRKAITNKPFILRVDKTDLAEGLPHGRSNITVKPHPFTRVRLDALDRLGDALAETSIRRLLLHTCRTGLDAEFLQMLADRLRVPVIGQRDWVDFLGEPDPASVYRDANPVMPRDQRFWPIQKATEPFFPRNPPPPRHGVP